LYSEFLSCGNRDAKAREEAAPGLDKHDAGNVAVVDVKDMRHVMLNKPPVEVLGDFSGRSESRGACKQCAYRFPIDELQNV
jgi:hypothetical protein